ncbi:MAG: NDP-sugar synthase [Gemmatimonadota bacterium]|nr:NDP-sugar synthase [Gemmatimonadota bacterium]
MVLAAGFGTRLLPLTARISKVSLPVAGVPLLGRVLAFLHSAGVDEFVVNLHHGPDTVRACLKDRVPGVEFSFEEQILGTGGGLSLAGDHFSGDGTFLMVNGDCMYDGCPLAEAVESHKSHGALATMVLIDMPPGEKYAPVEIDSDGRLLNIARLLEHTEKSPGSRLLHFTGIHILEPEILDHLPGGFSDINRDVYLRLIEEGHPLYGYHTSFDWADLGTPRRFLECAFNLLEGCVTGEQGPGVLVGEDARIDSSASLQGPLEIGPGCVVAQGVKIKRSVLGPGVSLGGGAVLDECLIGEGVRIDEGARLVRCVAAEVDGRIEVRKWDLEE